MTTQTSTSFILFLISLFISTCVIAATCLFSYYNVGKENLIFLGAGQFLVAMIAPIGIYIGIKTTAKKLNKVGLWGNVFLLFYTLSLMVMALII